MDLNLNQEQKLMLGGLVASLLVGMGVLFYQHAADSSQAITVEDHKTESPVSISGVLVHISGAVRQEGVYRLKKGDRLLDALSLAGGCIPSADLSALNLAEELKDGEKIIVPARSTDREENTFGDSNAAIVNINRADEKALDALPGIGASTAKEIVAYRARNGPFTRIEQIMEIPRFGKSKFERIKNRIRI